MHLPPRPHHSPIQLWATTIWVPAVGRHSLSERFAQMGDEVGWLHGQPRAAKMPQQGYGQGVAGMPQECHGWVKRPQGRPQATQESGKGGY